MNIVRWIAARVRMFGNRFAGAFGNSYSIMYYGTIVKMSYANFKHDPNPLILVLYSGVKYTHALNLNYLSHNEKQYIGRLLYSLKMGRQIIDGKTLYLLLKRDVYRSIVSKAYRQYFSNMIMHPKMVSPGFTGLEKMTYPFNDPFIVSLNRYLSGSNMNYVRTQVAYYPQELRDRVIMAINSTPVGRSATINTSIGTQPMVSATTPTERNI